MLVQLNNPSTAEVYFIDIAQGIMPTANYTIEIPETAVIVDTWDALSAEAAKYPWSMLQPKYNGNVIEVDGIIKLATTDQLSKQIEDRVASIPAPREEEVAEGERQERHLIEHHMPLKEREKWKHENPDVWSKLDKCVDDVVRNDCKACQEEHQPSQEDDETGSATQL